MEKFYQAKQGFARREIAGEVLLVPVGATTRELNGMILLNETGDYLWDLLAEKRTREELVAEMKKEFDASAEEISGDVDEFLETGVDRGVILQS